MQWVETYLADATKRIKKKISGLEWTVKDTCLSIPF